MESLRRAADTIFINCRVYTVDSAFSTASAIAVGDGKILWAGSGSQVKKFAGSGTKVIDLGGRTVLPGMAESHMHIPMYGEKLLSVDCFGKDKAEILRDVAATYKNIRPGEWITGTGWNETGWEDKKLPSKKELDGVAPGVPVCITRVCGHLAWVNSKAMSLAGIDGAPDPVGGEIHRLPSGEATGILVDTAASVVQKLVPPMSGERREEAYRLAQEALLSNGFTFAHDMAGGSDCGLESVRYLAGLYAKGVMKIAVSAYVSAEDAGTAYEYGPVIGACGGKLSMRGVKIFTDGSLGARSAWLLEDYADRPGHRGNNRYADDELYSLMLGARENGFQIAVHAIGDAANRQVIDAYERLLREIPEPADHRLRIEHAQILAQNDLKRLLALKIIPSMQFVHCTSDKEMTEERLGNARLPGSYAWRSLIDGGAIIPGGSDAPVELINPFHGMYAAVTRKDRAGRPDGGWRPEQKLTREEAVRAFTIWGAYAAFEEGSRGSIEPGKNADFTIVDRDVMNCPEDDIKDVSVIAVVMDGETAYGEVDAGA